MEMIQAPAPAGNVADTVSTTPSPLAVERAFRLARMHGHLWAQWDAQPCYLAFGRAIKARQEAAAAYLFETLRPKEDYDATQLAYQRLVAANHAYQEACALASDSEDSWPGDEDIWPEAKAPANHEEATFLSLAAAHLDQGPCGGIGYAPRPDGVIRHITGTGRLTWEVQQDGTVFFSVHRPRHLVLSAMVDPAGTVKVLVLNPFGTGVALREGCAGRARVGTRKGETTGTGPAGHGPTDAQASTRSAGMRTERQLMESCKARTTGGA